MRGLTAVALVGLLCVFAVGCAEFGRAPVMPPVGLIYTDVTAPLDVDLDRTQLGTKSGRASASSILGLFATGDSSTAAAARNGGLRVINHADYKMTSILSLFTTHTTIVYGD